jgi:hypothetical protein
MRMHSKRYKYGEFSVGWETAANKREHRCGGESGIRTLQSREQIPQAQPPQIQSVR